MTREATITTAILKALNALDGCCAWKEHGSMYSHAGQPDLSAVKDGRYYALEVKRLGQKPTAIQERRMAQLRAAGARVAIVHSVEEALNALKA